MAPLVKKTYSRKGNQTTSSESSLANCYSDDCEKENLNIRKSKKQALRKLKKSDVNDLFEVDIDDRKKDDPFDKVYNSPAKREVSYKPMDHFWQKKLADLESSKPKKEVGLYELSDSDTESSSDSRKRKGKRKKTTTQRRKQPAYQFDYNSICSKLKEKAVIDPKQEAALVREKLLLNREKQKLGGKNDKLILEMNSSVVGITSTPGKKSSMNLVGGSNFSFCSPIPNSQTFCHVQISPNSSKLNFDRSVFTTPVSSSKRKSDELVSEELCETKIELSETLKPVDESKGNEKIEQSSAFLGFDSHDLKHSNMRLSVCFSSSDAIKDSKGYSNESVYDSAISDNEAESDLYESAYTILEDNLNVSSSKPDVKLANMQNVCSSSRVSQTSSEKFHDSSKKLQSCEYSANESDKKSTVMENASSSSQDSHESSQEFNNSQRKLQSCENSANKSEKESLEKTFLVNNGISDVSHNDVDVERSLSEQLSCEKFKSAMNSSYESDCKDLYEKADESSRENSHDAINGLNVNSCENSYGDLNEDSVNESSHEYSHESGELGISGLNESSCENSYEENSLHSSNNYSHENSELGVNSSSFSENSHEYMSNYENSYGHDSSQNSYEKQNSSQNSCENQNSSQNSYEKQNSCENDLSEDSTDQSSCESDDISDISPKDSANHTKDENFNHSYSSSEKSDIGEVCNNETSMNEKSPDEVKNNSFDLSLFSNVTIRRRYKFNTTQPNENTEPDKFSTSSGIENGYSVSSQCSSESVDKTVIKKSLPTGNNSSVIETSPVNKTARNRDSHEDGKQTSVIHNFIPSPMPDMEVEEAMSVDSTPVKPASFLSPVMESTFCGRKTGFASHPVFESTLRLSQIGVFCPYKDRTIGEISMIQNAPEETLNCSVMLKTGKKWVRSMSVLKQLQDGVSLESSNVKGRKYEEFVKEVIGMQSEILQESILNPDLEISRNVNALSHQMSGIGLGRRSLANHSVKLIPSRDSKRRTSVFQAALGIVDEESDEADETLKAESRHLTAKDVVLMRCNQTEPLPFEEYFNERTLPGCRKIGEGVYGEVFTYDGDSTVIKVIPIEGSDLVNGEKQKKFEEILSEVVIAMELSNLRNGTKNRTDGFNELKKCWCVFGKYPKYLMKLWRDYDALKGSENDSPAIFKSDQTYVVLELANGGTDLEAFVFNSAEQSLSLFVQIAFTLAVAEKSLEFEHRDLHWGNILISKTEEKCTAFLIDEIEYKIPTKGVKVTIIDFTLSRMSYDGCCIFNDLSVDPGLFTSEGDYQFEMYRMMKNEVRNDWSQFKPKNNLFWMHYVLDKMITLVRYKKKNTKVHTNNVKTLKDLKSKVLNYVNSTEFVVSEDLCQ